MIRNKSGKKKLLSSSEGMGHGVEAGLLDGPPGLLFLASLLADLALAPPVSGVV